MTKEDDELREALPDIDPHDHPEPRAFKWTETEIYWIKEYAYQFAKQALAASKTAPQCPSCNAVVLYECPACGKSTYPQPEPVEWTNGANLFKDWCTNWFGPDADESYLAQAVNELPMMANPLREAIAKKDEALQACVGAAVGAANYIDVLGGDSKGFRAAINQAKEAL